MNKTLIFLFCMALLNFAACNQDADMETIITDLPRAYDHPPRALLFIDGIKFAALQSDSIYVINTEDEFLKLCTRQHEYIYMGGRETVEYIPQIDFAKKTVVLAYGNNPEKRFLFSTLERFGDNCTLHIITKNISHTENAYYTQWFVAAVVDKITTKVRLNLTNELYMQEGDCIQNDDYRQSDSIFVINTAEDLEKYCINESNPQIDITKKTALLMRGTSYSGTSFFIELIRKSNDYTVDIHIPESSIDYGIRWTVGFAVDKISTGVKFNIKYEADYPLFYGQRTVFAGFGNVAPESHKIVLQ